MIYNNLKGRIVGIERVPGRIQFDVELDRPLSEFDVDGDELEWMGDSTVRFSVYEYDTSDEDDDSLNTTVPFQVAYAVSIHKAQGLEYDSVKIVITDANEDDITHSIFYTAVTRARERLRIFWTPETQQAVLKSLHRSTNPKDVALLSSRRGLTPVLGLDEPPSRSARRRGGGRATQPPSKSFKMAKSDLQARPVYYPKRDFIEPHLTVVFAALAVGG